MSRIRSKDTKPEMIVRRLVHGMGYRYRLHGQRLPGRPDLVFASQKKVIFVHGCFWHFHKGCGRIPDSRLEFWKSKLHNNRKRDSRNQLKLARLGWSCLVVWECELKNLLACTSRIRVFLE